MAYDEFLESFQKSDTEVFETVSSNCNIAVFFRTTVTDPSILILLIVSL